MLYECKLFYVLLIVVCWCKCSNGGKCVVLNKCLCWWDYKGR